VLLLVCALFFTVCAAEIFFQEEFGDGWENRWVVSDNKKAEGTAGEFIVSAGKHFGDPKADQGLKTTQDAKFYQISAELPKEFNNKDRTLVLQFSVKHEQHIDCGGGYVKLLPAGLDQTDFSGDSDYNVMFGPDICGMLRRVHTIFHYKEKNHLIKSPDIKAEHDEFTHLYTLVAYPNQTFNVLIDSKSVRNGSLFDNWDFLPPREILDPSVSKPLDWVDEREIVDPKAVKPAGWDDIPAQTKDKDAKRPDDWDTELDGEWEPPVIDNPEFKGEWKAPMIDNPAYKGEWVHPKIPNPDFHEDSTIGKYDSFKYIGIEIWQVKSGTIFDNFLVTDSLETAHQWAAKTVKTQEGEKVAHKKEQEEKAAERIKEAEKFKSEQSAKEEEEEEDIDLEEEDPGEDLFGHDEL